MVLTLTFLDRCSSWYSISRHMIWIPLGEFPIHHDYILIDPMSSVRAMVNTGAEEYQVTTNSVPSFLYDDPLQFDPNDVFTGFMRGCFLICVSEKMIVPREKVTSLPVCVCHFLRTKQGHQWTWPPSEDHPGLLLWPWQLRYRCLFLFPFPFSLVPYTPPPLLYLWHMIWTSVTS